MRARSKMMEFGTVWWWMSRKSSDFPDAGGPTTRTPRLLSIGVEELRKLLHSEQRATMASEFSTSDEKKTGSSIGTAPMETSACCKEGGDVWAARRGGWWD